MSYATVQDVEARTGKTYSPSEQTVIEAQLADAGILIDSFNEDASAESKLTVSCRMVIRTLNNDSSVPIGAMQGSMSGLGYSQTWTMGTGASGELYLSKQDKQLLGGGNSIGSYSPVQELCGGDSPW